MSVPEFAATQAEDLPPASAELVLIRVMVTAYLATAHCKPRSRAREFVKVASGILADEESASLVFPIRPMSQQHKTALARRQAVAMFRQYMPVFMAAVPREDEA